MTNKLFNFVDYAGYINLKNRTDKREYIERHFAELGILQYVNRFDATEPSEFAKMMFPDMDVSLIDNSKVTSDIKAHCCWIGHYRIIKEAKRLGAKNALVFEDDVQFYKPVNYSPIDLIRSALAQLKNIPDWQVVYLGALADPHNQQAVYDLVTPNLIKVYQCYGAHAILYNSTIFDQVIYDCENFSKDYPPVSADEYLNIGNVFKHKYIVYPMAAIQKEFNSDIVNGKRDWYKWEESYSKIKNRINILF